MKLPRFIKKTWFIILISIWVVVLAVVWVARHYYLNIITGKDLRLLKATAHQVNSLLEAHQVERYDIQVELEPEDNRLQVVATIDFNVPVTGKKWLFFLFNQGFKIHSIRWAAKPARFWRIWLLLMIRLPGELAKGESGRLTFEYEGTPQPTGISISPSYLTADECLLSVDEFWYPATLQGFFHLEMTCTIPKSHQAIYAGTLISETEHGELKTLRWCYARPINGLSLITGQFNMWEQILNDIHYRVALAKGLALAPESIMADMIESNQILTHQYGASGHGGFTIAVSNRLKRGFHDGSGLVGLNNRYFGNPHHEFALIAHEMAHNWWGGTVTQRWLASDNSGGEWLVEGFAEFSSLYAVKQRYDQAAVLEKLAGWRFNPKSARMPLEQFTVLENLSADSDDLANIYNKSAYVNYMLFEILGECLFFQATKRFLDQERYHYSSDDRFQQVTEKVTGQDLDWFFTPWLRTTRYIDFAFEVPKFELDSGRYVTRFILVNKGNLTMPMSCELHFVSADEIFEQKVNITTSRQQVIFTSEKPLQEIIIDPGLKWADMFRENNHFLIKK